jgi:two-component sensor histidine kinase
MNTSDLETSIGFQSGRVVPAECQDAAVGSRTDPETASDSLRADAAENTRLRARIRDLSRENSDMNRMLEGIGIPVVLFDRKLRVLRFAPTTKEMGSEWLVDVIGEARSVLDTLHPKEVDIQATDGRWYRTHVHSYRSLDGRIERVVVSYVDISEHRKAEQEITGRLARKDILLKEVHHRVRNNTASIAGILSIQAQSITDPVARSVLQGAIGRVESMSVLYDKLLVSEQSGSSSVKDYLEDLADSIMALFPEGSHITIEKRIIDFDMKSGDLVLLGLITNELLTNVQKYAFDGRSDGHITLSLERFGNSLRLVVQDDGVGLSSGFRFRPGSATGFGMHLIKMLCEQLDGTLSISTGTGTRIELTFSP